MPSHFGISAIFPFCCYSRLGASVLLAMAVDPKPAGSASGAVVFSQFFWPASLQQLTGLLADDT